MRRRRRVPQEHVDSILSWDLSRYVCRAPDNVDSMPFSEEFKAEYRAVQLRSVAHMREIRRTRAELQGFVRAHLEERGYVEADPEMFAKYKRELQPQG